MTQIATAVYGLIILGLFWLDTDRKAQTSRALWLPVTWLLLAASRSVAQWMQAGEPMSLSEQQKLIEGSSIDRFIYTGLLVIGLSVLVSRKRQIGELLRSNGPILLFFFYCITSLLWSDYPDIALKRWIKALGDFVMVIIVWTDREPHTAVQRLLARASFLLIPLSVLFIKYYPAIGKGYGEWDYVARYTGVTTNKNTLGVICLFFGLGAVWRLLVTYKGRGTEGNTRRLIAHAIIVAMVLWLFSMANSMTSLSCFLMGSGLLLATHLRAVTRRPAFVHMLVATVILVPFSTLFLGLGSGAARGALTRDLDTLTDRTNVWKLALSVAANPWVGTGFESFWLGRRLQAMWNGFSWHPGEAHNGYLEIYLNLGWTGLVLLAIVIIKGYRTVVQGFRRNLPTSNLMLAFFAVGVVYNFTEAAFFRMMAPAWIFFLLAITSAPEVTHPKIRKSARIVPSFTGSFPASTA